MTGAAERRAAYGQLTRFLVPLILTQLIAESGNQVLNGGMARVPRPTHTLAAFGLAWGLGRAELRRGYDPRPGGTLVQHHGDR